MRKIASNMDTASVDSSTREMEAHTEQEYGNLKRQFRIMEADRNSYQQRVQHHISRQNKLISRLRQEEEELTTNQRLAESSAVRKRESSNYQELSNLAQAQRLYMDVVSNEKSCIDTLRQNIADLEEQIEQQQQKSGGAISSHERHVGRLKKISVLENRLNTATVQFNKLLTENSKLRESIEHYRSQRKVFSTLYKRLTTKIETQKSEIAMVIDTATSAYDQRDDARAKMLSLKERNEQDLSHFISEFKEMNRVIAHETKLQDFMNVKNCELAELAVAEAKRRRQGHAFRAETLEEEEMVKFEKVLAAIIKVLGKDQADKLQKVLKEASEGHKMSVEESNVIASIQPICERYRKTEEQNYSLFMFVNEMSQDVKRLNEKIGEIRGNTTNEQTKKEQVSTDQQKNLISISNKLKQHEHIQKNANVKVSNAKKSYDKLKDQVHNLFVQLTCSEDPIRLLLNSHGVITDENLALYLSAIEDKVNQLLEWHALIKSHQAEENPDSRRNTPTDGRRSTHNLSPHRKSVVNPLHNEPQISSFEVVDARFADLDKKPLSHDELQMRAKYLITDKERSRSAAASTPRTPKDKLLSKR